MRKNDLINRLAVIPGNPVVALLDAPKNIAADTGEGSSEGVYPDFSVEYMGKDNVPDGHKPWISIQFTPDPPEA